MKKILKRCLSALVFGEILTISSAIAEEAQSSDEMNTATEEVVVIGRFYSASQRLMDERIEDDAVVDILDADSISRMGDSTVAAALRRITGVSLVNDKFVYVRGLGERYSSTTLNGASVPSPDLTRNVIPLDLFPSSIVSGLAVQKTFAVENSANFAGGLIDIRTTAFPDIGFNFSAELGSGTNFETGDRVLSYNGGEDDDWGTDDGTRALSQTILNGLAKYQGRLSPQAILQRLMKSTDGSVTLSDAKAINRQMALALNRSVGLKDKDSSPDLNGKVSVGNTFDLTDELEFGLQLSGAYDRQWRHSTRNSFNYGNPTEEIEVENESTRATNLTGTGTAGLRYLDEHEVTYSGIFLRNTDDEAAIRDYHNDNRQLSEEIGFREYRSEFEEREMTVNQLSGTHRIGYFTKGLLAGVLDFVPEEAELKWFWSESAAETDIPNRVTVDMRTTTTDLGSVITEVMEQNSSAADFRFTELQDDVMSYGWNATMPWETERTRLEIRFGYAHDQKARVYAQREFGMGPVVFASSDLTNVSVSDVLSDANINNELNDFEFTVQGSGTRSYFAATMTDSQFGAVDWTIDDRIRIIAGIRNEYYRQAAVPWNIYGYTIEKPQVTADPEILSGMVFEDNASFPSLSAVYMSDWLAKTFQFRFGWSETAIRPDLREVTDASYQDPISGELVNGNPNVIPATVSNYDARAEWFFDNGNALTISAFMKDIDNPIEYFESPASDTNTARQIVNAEKTEILGIEIDGLVNLGFLGVHAANYFVQGNITFQDSETSAGVRADAPTNNVRSATGASDYIANLMLGFDSKDNKHTASLMYNLFGERLYVAGRLGTPDGFEQPFHSIDFTYSWYPTEQMTLKLKIQNLLDEEIEIQRGSVVVFREKPGMTVSAKVKYSF